MKEQPTTEIVTVPQDEKGTIEIVPFGTDERIRLSAAIVRQQIAVPTRTGKQPDDKQCIKFMMLCRARHLNPWEGDAYMLGYDTQSGPQFSLTTAHQVFLKRAEASKGFNGMESGVIVERAIGADLSNIVEREGDLVYDGERLIGGWAKVYRKDREKPFYRRLKLATFNTNRSRWEKDPAGVIVKCAEADALRSAFPTHLGGLFIDEELPPIDVGPVIERAKIPKISAGNGVQTTPPITQKESDKPDSPAETPSPKKKPLLKRKNSLSRQNTLEKQMLERLKVGNRTPQDLLKVAIAYEWCSPDETWPLPEQKLELFLEPENFALLMEEMDNLPASVMHL